MFLVFDNTFEKKCSGYIKKHFVAIRVTITVKKCFFIQVKYISQCFSVGLGSTIVPENMVK